MNYDFSQLNDKEFEEFSCNLLSAYFKTKIERFKIGRDGGVDGRFFSDSGHEIVVQCKHYIKSGYTTLLSKLKKEEVPKVKKLNPSKYIITTSLPLSRANKEQIRSVFNPFIKSVQDIFGQEDLNDLLSQNPKIEEKHFKLWISSTNTLQRIINNAIKGRSEFELRRIISKASIFVKTADYEKALKKLEENRVIIISGEPGIGKTTLAENICIKFVAKGYEFISIEESLSEAENIYKIGELQLFLYDDFLGSNYFEAIENKKDSHIIKFIERIKNDKTKLFILTSRTNILLSGYTHSSCFSTNKIEKNDYILQVQNLSMLDKANILYNHIWCSNLSNEFIEELYESKRYKEIIIHVNFNPRIIEFINDIERINVEPSEYWNFIKEKLNNPKDIWDVCFKTQNNPFVRCLVLLTVFNGRTISEEFLKRGYNRFVELENIQIYSHTEKDFNSQSKLASSFLNRNNIKNKISYTLFNPSISDYILNEYTNDVNKLLKVYKALDTTQSLDELLSLAKASLIDNKDFNNIINELFFDAFNQKKGFDYLIKISYHFIFDENKEQFIIEMLKNLIINFTPINQIYDFFMLLIEYKSKIVISNTDFLLEIMNSNNLEKEELNKLSKLLFEYKINNKVVLQSYTEQIYNILYDEIDNFKEDFNFQDYIEYCNSYSEGTDIFFDESAIKDNFEAHLETTLNEINVNQVGMNLTDFDLSDILHELDTDKMYSDFIKSNSYEPDFDDDFHGKSGSFTNSTLFDEIDDLFERS